MNAHTLASINCETERVGVKTFGLSTMTPAHSMTIVGCHKSR